MYWESREKSVETYAGDLVMSGDLVERDADGKPKEGEENKTVRELKQLNSMKANRRRSAWSTKAIDRSAVFIVPMMRMLLRIRSVRPPARGIVLSRYSSRYINSPNTRDKLARLISSTINTQVS